MAQAYMAAMQHSQWHCRNVLHNRAKKRPLGRLEAQYDFKPRQPVLSSRTVDIDMSGTRTYRAKSTGDIIDEQHKLIHEVYSKARNIASAQPGKRFHSEETPHNSQVKIMSLRFLSVDGECSRRPGTGTRSEINANASPAQMRRRPHTTGGRSYRRVVDQEPVRPDHTEKETLAAYHNVQQELRHQWLPGTHDLQQGAYVRGKRPDQPGVTEGKTATAWLSFGGGQDNREGGIVEAFAGDLKYNNEFYQVDGSTGIQVARQLRGGDRIRIGINGKIPPKLDPELLMDERIQGPGSDYKASTVPLCWKDQVTDPEVKLIQLNEKEPQKTMKTNLCESRPVVFDRSHQKEPTWEFCSPSPTRMAGEGNYRVRARSKKHVGLNGEGSGVITSLTVDPCDLEAREEEMEHLSIDEVLDRVMSEQQQQANVGFSEDAAITSVSITNLEQEAYDEPALSEPENHRPKSGFSGPLSCGEPRASIPSKTIVAAQQDWDQDCIRVTNSTGIPVAGGQGRAGRVGSGKRPTPVGKWSATRGGSARGDRSYIRITQPCPTLVAHHAMKAQEAAMVRATPTDAIQSVLEHNSQMPLREASVHKAPIPEHEDGQMVSPSSCGHTPDMKYSFTVPTAENMEPEGDYMEADKDTIRGSQLGPTTQFTTEDTQCDNQLDTLTQPAPEQSHDNHADCADCLGENGSNPTAENMHSTLINDALNDAS